MRLSLALVVASLLLALAPAGASAYLSPGEPVADPQVDGWVAVARATWGAEPACPEGVRLDRAQRLPDAGLWAAAEMPGCHISLDPDFYPAPALWTATAAGRAQWGEQMCNVVVHEWGHLLGHAHVDDPHDLMAAVVPRVVPACRAAAPPVVAKTPAPRARRSARKAAAKRRPARRTLARKSARAHVLGGEVDGLHGPLAPTPFAGLLSPAGVAFSA
jgi:hypothetical protein